MRTHGIFITGTDTDVGKTWLATRLIGALRNSGVEAVGMKPVECGGHDDRDAILEACGNAGISADEVNPIYVAEPVAPIASANPVTIDFDDLHGRLLRLRERFDSVVVEGAGGWLVPLDQSGTVEDLAVHFGLPVLIVASDRLGVLNHTLLTIRAVRASGLACAGVFLNRFEPADLSRETNADVLRRLLPDLPIHEKVEEVAAAVLAAKGAPFGECGE